MLPAPYSVTGPLPWAIGWAIAPEVCSSISLRVLGTLPSDPHSDQTQDSPASCHSSQNRCYPSLHSHLGGVASPTG